MNCLRNKKRCLLLVAASAAVSLGCGGYSEPSSMLDSSSLVLEMPPVPLALELKRIPLPKPPPFKLVIPPQTPPANGGWRDERSANGVDSAASTCDADLSDLQEALAALHLPEDARKPLIEGYAAVRAELQKHTADSAVWAALYDFEREKTPKPAVPALAVPKGLPAEFDLYLTGAIAWHEKKPDAAITAWKKLLDLPEKERSYRSTWAAFMIGKTLLATAPAEAVPWFEKTRSLAQAGFADRLGLAADSIGWQAQAECRSKHFQKALDLYMLQRAAGADVTVSVRFVCHAILGAGPDEILKAARDPLSRRLVTAALVANHSGWDDRDGKRFGEAWFDALDKARVTALEDADRLAWIAYEDGDMATARRWLERAPDDSAPAAWLHAKLLLRDNKPKEAAPFLAKVVKLLPQDPTLGAMGKSVEGDQERNWDWDFPYGPVPASQVLGDIGVVHLARREFTEALDSLLAAGFEGDAAYLAERVLTPEELIQCADCNVNSGYIRDVLARRLIRAGRMEQARKYLSTDAVHFLDAYATALAAGRDAKRPQAERAAALWKAALMADEHRYQLLYNNTEPNWYLNFGVVDLKQTWDARRAETAIPLLKPTDDEEQRLKATASIHEKSSQRPYIAADLAWEAIRLMPDNSDETARALIVAGNWLKARDPKAADRFYKALVRRCGKTALGREADTLRWFPKLEAGKAATTAEPGAQR